MSMTSVLGHIESIEFPNEYSNWSSVDPFQLLQAPIISSFDSNVRPFIILLLTFFSEQPYLIRTIKSLLKHLKEKPGFQIF